MKETCGIHKGTKAGLQMLETHHNAWWYTASEMLIFSHCHI